MAIPLGRPNTGMVSVTVLVTVSITERFQERKLVTYAARPSGESATRLGFRYTSTVARTTFAAVSMTDTVPGRRVKELVTYTAAPSGVTATASAPCPTLTREITPGSAVSMTDTVAEA